MKFQAMNCLKHDEKPICKCGVNTLCKYCGHGQGSIPCDCSLRREFQVWDELSDEAIKNVELELSSNSKDGFTS